MSITIREMQRHDLERLHELSPSVEGAGEGNVKNPAEFHAYPTLVAVADPSVAKRMVDNGEVPVSAVSPDGLVVGYAQYTITPDGTLVSQAIRVSRKFKGQGIGAMLVAERVRIARSVGAVFHLYAVDPDGEQALKKILIARGMHLCRKLPKIWLYAEDLTEAEEMGYTEPDWPSVEDVEAEQCARHGEVCA